jgi:Holliday junction resolvase RusA-like endonuclease
MGRMKEYAIANALNSFDDDVTGTPEPQGSSRAFMHKGRPIITSANRKLRPWRARLDASFSARVGDRTPMIGPVSVTMTFRMPRPKSHTGAHGLTPSATGAAPDTRPDVDKLARAVNDALTTAGVIYDDSQITRIIAAKRYADPHEHPGVTVAVNRDRAR